MKQISWVVLFAALIGCSEMVPGTCYENPAGGAGDGDPIPSTGVGATSGTGDYPASPESEPLGVGDGDGNGDTYGICVSDNPCEICQSGQLKRYMPSEFQFVTTVADDGTDISGGWQEAKVTLGVKRERFSPVYWVETWRCPQWTFRMPVRNVAQGKISPTKAASVSAQVANEAAEAILATDYFIKQGRFCSRFREELKKNLPKAVAGATVTQP